MALILLCCAGCAQRPASRFDQPAERPLSAKSLGARPVERIPHNPELPPVAAAPVTRTAAVRPEVSEAQARTQFAQALALVDQTRAIVAGWNAADAAIAESRAALAQRRWGVAFGSAEEARARAELALSAHFTRLAQAEAQRGHAFTGLDEAQLAQLRAAEDLLGSGQARLAYGRLRTLNDQLQKRFDSYTVAPGDTLQSIAARAEIYANRGLWPLLWEANRATLPQPDRLRSGQVLRVRRHPTTDEVAEALATR